MTAGRSVTILKIVGNLLEKYLNPWELLQLLGRCKDEGGMRVVSKLL